MSNNKQSAVSFLIKEFSTLANASILGKIDNVHFIKRKQEIIEQAKEIEKQHIIDAYKFAIKFAIQDNYVIGSEDYYNKTFKD